VALDGALSGVVVVDLTRQMSGPYATLVLGDFGADVIKVESHPNGDPSRRVGHYFSGGESTMFLTWNRNKRSLCVDLRRPEGVAIVKRLAHSSDVFVENYRPGVADQMGLGWKDLHELNPRLIYVSVSAFGSKGPWKDRPGTDPAVQAFSGVMSVTGAPDGPPVLVGVPIADFSSAMLTVQAVLLGLFARSVSGDGQYIELSLLGSLLFSLTTRVGPYFLTGQDPTPSGGSHSQVAPYGAYQTLDGWVVIGTWGDEGWLSFCQALGMPDLANDERFVTNTNRMQHRDELDSIVSAQMITKTNDQWDRSFAQNSVLFSPVNTFSQVLGHVQTTANEHVVQVDHPTAGRLRQVAPAIKMSGTPAVIRRPPPLLGEHSRDILDQHGWSQAEIDELVATGVVIDSAGQTHPRS
jgi:crotonobetainyl-CoA:carnitine CoA-transferase CaiB-like acyl-CoA transferase